MMMRLSEGGIVPVQSLLVPYDGVSTLWHMPIVYT